MLDFKKIINNSKLVKEKLKTRNFDVSIIDKILKLSKERSNVMTYLQKLESKKNLISKNIGYKKLKNESIDKDLKNVAKIKEEIEKINSKEKEVNLNIKNKLLYIPNLPNENTPIGKDEKSNVLIKEYFFLGRGKVTNVEAHYEIAKKLDIVDFKRAVKLSGSRYWAYKGLGAKLLRALENYMLDKHIENNYIEWNVPIIVKNNILEGTGQLPKFKKDLFKIENLNSYLIPTTEVPLTNLFNNEIIDLSTPIAYTAYSLCFRSEAGSGGKDIKGLIRAHQFNKVELVKFVSKEDHKLEFIKTVNDAKSILEDLELPYQEIQLCTGDLGFSAEETIDLEVWIPSEKKYREISSISSFSDFQGRRASIRYKDKTNKNQIAYTINGSGLAIDRTIAAILEIYQNKDGSITIPKVLIPYMKLELIK